MAAISVIFLSWRRRRLREILPYGLSLKHLHVLGQLERREFLYPAEIAEMLFCDRPTATVVIRTMERHGWVLRTRDPQNRKRFRIALTPAGRRKSEEVREARLGQPDPELLAGFGPDEVAELWRLLSRLQRRLTERPE